MTRAGPSGFTLLEVLISMAITAMLMTAAVATFRAINRTQDRVRPETNRSESARVLLDRMERELVSTTLLVKRPFASRLRHPWVFIGEDRVFGTNDSDALMFITSSPARPPGAAVAPGLRLVTYAVGTVDEGEEELALYRAERRLPRRLQKEVNLQRAVPILGDVRSLQLRYLSKDGWRDSWDSTDIAQLDTLPEAVEISVRLYEELPDGSLNEGAEQRRTIPLPVRPLTRASAGAVDASCAGGVTVTGCMQRLRPRIKKLQRTLRDPITALRRNVRDHCWASDTASQQLLSLKKALSTLLDSDPDEICS